jgi:hypothetical protein
MDSEKDMPWSSLICIGIPHAGPLPVIAEILADSQRISGGWHKKVALS